MSQGDLKALEELCKETPGGLPDAQQFLNVMEELNQLVAQGYALVNTMNSIQDQLNEAQNTLEQDQKDLADCQAINSGSNASAATA